MSKMRELSLLFKKKIMSNIEINAITLDIFWGLPF